MGSNSTSSSQTSTTSLPEGQQRNVDQLLQGALDFFNSGGRDFFPGDIIADFNPLQTQGQNNITNFAGGVGSDLASNAIEANNRFLDPSMLDISAQPGFMSTIDDILRRSTQNLNENILPGISAGGIASGQFGGTPTGVAEGLAVGRTGEANRGMISDLTLGQYGLGLNAMQNGIANSPGLFNLGLQPGSAIAGVGDIRQNQAQNEIQGNVARHEFDQNEPIQMLQLLRDLTGQSGTFGGTTQTSTEQNNKSSPINTALGALMTGASLFNPVSSIFSGLAGTGIGGIGGGVGGGFAQAGLPSPFGGNGNALDISQLLQGIGGQ